MVEQSNRDDMSRWVKRTVSVACSSIVIAAMVTSHAQAAPKTSRELAAREPAARNTAPLARLDAAPGALSKAVIPLKVTAHIDLDPYRDDFFGDARYELRLRQSVRTITMHARDLAVSDARLTGQRQAPTIHLDAKAQTVTLRFARPVPAGRHELSLRFAGKLHERGDGLYRVAATGNKDRKLIATEMEPTGARLMLPCFDEPAFRTVWEMAFTTDARHTVVSNMPALRRIDTGRGRVRTQFAPTPPMSSYLLAVAVGEFDKLSARHDAVELNIIVPPGEAAKAQQAMTWSQGLLRWYEDYFRQPYALPKLDQIAIPAKGLAMENWGLITYPESWILYDPAHASADKDFYTHGILAHEIGHQWFGNLVTMAWWDDLWLNEAFATWVTIKATQALQPTWEIDSRRLGEREQAMAQDILATAKPIARDVPRDTLALASFDRISYQKGAAVLRMIERAVGEDAFREGLRSYMRANRMGNTVADDLWGALVAAAASAKATNGTNAFNATNASNASNTTNASEPPNASSASNSPNASNASNSAIAKTMSSTPPTPRAQDLRAFARAWTTQPGFPLVDVSQRCDAGRGIVRVAQRRFVLREGYAPDLRWPIALELKAGAHLHRVDSGGEPVEIDVGRCDEVVLADPGAHGYFRVRYDNALAARVADRFASLDAADQQRVLLDAWAAAQAGLAPVQQVLALLDKLPSQASASVWRVATRIGVGMVELMRGGKDQAALQARVRGVLAARQRTLGWNVAANDDAITRALRGDLIGALGAFDDADTVAEAKRRFADRERDPAALMGDVGSALLGVVGRHASVDEWNALLAMLGDKRFAITLAWPLSRALGATRDGAVARHAMQASLDGKLPRVVGNRIFGALASEGHEREVWAFVQAHRRALLDRSDDWSRRRLYPSVLSDSRDTQLAQDVRAAADRDLPADLREETRRAIEGVEQRAWAHDAVSKGLDAALAARP